MPLHFAESDNNQTKEKWTSCVQKHRASVFSTVTYLDACSVQWCVLFSEDEKSGMACPYVIKAGVKVLVTPFFVRYIEWVGDDFDEEAIQFHLQQEFSVADIQVKQAGEIGAKHFQQLIPGNLQLNQQAKRSLKKAQIFHKEERFLPELLFQLIELELSSKVHALNADTLKILQKLVTAFENKGLIQLNLYDNEAWFGALWLIEYEDTVLYLKGTVKESAKQQGGMYLLMKTAIEYAHSKSKKFDFGGSNVENVRRFNLSFGAEDVVYSHWVWNNAPMWWNFLRSIRSLWKRK